MRRYRVDFEIREQRHVVCNCNVVYKLYLISYFRAFSLAKVSFSRFLQVRVTNFKIFDDS